MLTFIILWTIIINVLRGVAQMGARVVWDHEVAGSIPVTPTTIQNAGVTQLVECHLAKVKVAGSSPVFRSTIKIFYIN